LPTREPRGYVIQSRECTAWAEHISRPLTHGVGRSLIRLRQDR
jgi:hypothetical protein